MTEVAHVAKTTNLGQIDAVDARHEPAVALHLPLVRGGYRRFWYGVVAASTACKETRSKRNRDKASGRRAPVLAPAIIPAS